MRMHIPSGKSNKRAAAMDPAVLLERITARIDEHAPAAVQRVIASIDYEPLKKYFQEKTEALERAIAFYAKVVFIGNMSKQPPNIHVQRLFDHRLDEMLRVFVSERVVPLGKDEVTKFVEMTQVDGSHIEFIDSVKAQCRWVAERSKSK